MTECDGHGSLVHPQTKAEIAAGESRFLHTPCPGCPVCEPAPEPDYPQHDKLMEEQEFTQALHDFVVMLRLEGVHLARYFTDEEVEEGGAEISGELAMFPLYEKDIDRLIGKARGIDTDALSEEKEAMYQALVAANKAAE